MGIFGLVHLVAADIHHFSNIVVLIPIGVITLLEYSSNSQLCSLINKDHSVMHAGKYIKGIFKKLNSTLTNSETCLSYS